MTSQQPPEGLSAELHWRKLGNTPVCEVLSMSADMLDEAAQRLGGLVDMPVNARKLRELAAFLKAARSTSPAPDPLGEGSTVKAEGPACPFCDRADLLAVETTSRGWRVVKCWACGAVGPVGRGEPDDAYALHQWARRTPAKAGEREQVAEAVERLKREIACTVIWPGQPNGVLVEVEDLRLALSALAEARSEVERVNGERREAIKLMSEYARQAGDAKGGLEMSEAAGIVDGWRERAEAAEAERDTLAAQLVGAREALEPFARIGDSYVEGDYGFRIESTRSRSAFGRMDVERARQALAAAEPPK